MKIRRYIPSPPPEITMNFSFNDGWAVLAALRFYAENHPHAADRAEWFQWADDLDKELRR